MTQPTYMNVDGEDNGPVFVTRLNEIINAHHTVFAGTTAPASPVANMVWQDTSVDPPLFRRRNSTNSAWDLMGSFSNEVYSGSCEGSAGSTNKLTTARSISCSGAAAGSASFDGSANADIVLTLANSGVSAGTYGGTSTCTSITVSSKGLITAISNSAIDYPVDSFNGRLGSVVLTQSDVFSVLPSKTGKANKYLRLSSDETSLQWGDETEEYKTVRTTTGNTITTTTADNGKYVISDTTLLSNSLTLHNNAPVGSVVKVMFTFVGDIYVNADVSISVSGGGSIISATESYSNRWIECVCVSNTGGTNAAWACGSTENTVAGTEGSGSE